MNWDAKTFGIVVSLFGVGATATYFYLSIRPIKNYKGFIYIAALAIGGIALGTIPFANDTWQMGMVLFVMGAFFGVTSTISTIIIQEKTDDEYRSRVMGIARISSLLTPIGFLLWGSLGDVFGNQTVFILAGLIVLVVSIGGAFTSLTSYKK